MTKALAFVLAAVVWVGSATAEIVYIRDGASGDGSSWSSALDDLPGTLVRGNTYYMAAGSYAARTFSTAASGTTRIIIKKATTSDHGTDTGWDAGYATGQVVFGYPLTFTTGYFTIDGQEGSGTDASSYGIALSKRSTATSPSNLVQIGTGTQTITGLEFRHIAAVNWDNAHDIEKIAWNQSGQATVSDITWSHIYTRYGQNSIKLLGVQTATIEYLFVEDPFSSAAHHGEVVNIRSLFSQPSRDITVRYSEIREWVGTGCIVFNNATTNDYAGDGVYIYGNTLGPCGDASGGNGYITSTSGAYATDVYVYQNALIGDDGVNPPWLAMRNSTGGTGSNLVARNNVLYNLDASIVDAGSAVWDADYNAYYSCSDVPTETHSVVASGNPFVDGANWDVRLVGGSSAIDGGVALESTYAIDAAGNTRGVDGAWDIGALEHQSGTSSPDAPTLTSATAQTAYSVALSLAAAGTGTAATSLRIERSTTSGSGFVEVASVAADATSYTDAVPTADRTYYYRIRARNAGGDSAYTSEASASTPAVSGSSTPTTSRGRGAVLFRR
jgi:hypothetical protein